MFLTHLDMEFPELSHIEAEVKGFVSPLERFVASLNLSVTSQLFPQTDKQKKNSGKLVGFIVSLNYRKASSTFCFFNFEQTSWIHSGFAVCVDEPCACADHLKRPRCGQRNVSQDLGS